MFDMRRVKEQIAELQDIHDTKGKQSLARGIFNKHANLDLVPTRKGSLEQCGSRKA